MPHFKISLYSAQALQARVVPLVWEAHRIPEEDEPNLDHVFREVPANSGVYAITGSHDAHGRDHVLYIGQSDTLDRRIKESVDERLFERHGDGRKRLCADVWDLTVRWARLDGAALVDAVESLLIVSHLPPLNSQEISGVRKDGPIAEDQDLVVMNAGRKGPLLPIVAGAYQSSWIDAQGRTWKREQAPGSGFVDKSDD